MSSMAMDTNNTIIHGKDPTHTGHKRSYMEVNMEEKADLMNTEKEEENTSTISLAWLMNHGTDAANSVLVERAAQQINALQKSSQG